LRIDCQVSQAIAACHWADDSVVDGVSQVSILQVKQQRILKSVITEYLVDCVSTSLGRDKGVLWHAVDSGKSVDGVASRQGRCRQIYTADSGVGTGVQDRLGVQKSVVDWAQ